MFEIVIVIPFAHWHEVLHLRQTFLQLVGVTVERGERLIARFHQLVVPVRRKIGIERHQTLVQERIDRAR